RILAAELSAGMEGGHDHLERADLRLRMDPHRDAAAVVYDAHVAAGQERHLDVVREAAHGLVAGVVEDLPDEVVEAVRTRRADVHARALAHRLEAFEYGNRGGIVRLT